MTAPLPLLTHEDVRHVLHDDEGFGCLSSTHGVLPLRSLQVRAQLIGTTASTVVEQTFVNNLSVPLEATYIFPLPDRAAVTRFVMVVGSRRIEGNLQERGQARANYDAAISSGKQAAIAEEERPGVFTLRVGNLMPGEVATITFDMVGALAMVDGEVSYRFPLIVAPRYMPGTPLSGASVGAGTHADTTAVPDASRISPPSMIAGYSHPVALSIEVIIDALGIPVKNVRSALHAASATGEGGRLHIRLAPGETLNRDFILRYQLGDGHLHTSAVATDRGSNDTCMITIVPNMTSLSRPRDVVFVIDVSGSMQGWKLVAARRAAARMVDGLRGHDRFALIAFHSHHRAYPAAHDNSGGAMWTVASDRERFQAVTWLSSLQAHGGTEMQAPLQTAARVLQSSSLERDRVMVFITDGQVGNEAQLLASLGNSLHGVRLFALGIDQAVNAGFLNRLAALGGQGEAELVESEDRLDEVLSRCHRRIETPAIRDIHIEAIGPHQLTQQAPARTPDVFVGVPQTVCVCLHRRGGTPTLRITGTLADGNVYQRDVVVQHSNSTALLPTWGRLHVRDLEDQFDGGQGDRHQLERSIVATSLGAGVLCRFTAFVAVGDEIVNPGGRVVEVVQPVDMAAAPQMKMRSAQTRGGSGGGMSAPPPPAPMAVARDEVMRSAPISRTPMERHREEPISRGEYRGAPADEDFEEQVRSAPPPSAARAKMEEKSKGAATTTWMDRLLWAIGMLKNQPTAASFQRQLTELDELVAQMHRDGLVVIAEELRPLVLRLRTIGAADEWTLKLLQQLVDRHHTTKRSFWK
jgi:Ca-activated chloride channel homolog